MQTVDLLPADEALSEQVVERWVAAALAEAMALRQLDGDLYPDDPGRLGRAHRLHDAWRQWAREAEILLGRLKAGGSSLLRRPDVLQLRQEAGWARALVEQSPEAILERLREVKAGKVIGIEEARRELRTRNRA